MANGVTLAANTTETVSANSTNVVAITPQREFVAKGMLSLAALPSATGMRLTLNVGGVTLIDDQPLPFFGTTGGMDVEKNNVISQLVAGGRVELKFRNTTGGSLTVDYILAHLAT